jgi:hypothetical protein
MSVQINNFEWDKEVIETRIANEAFAYKIKEFKLVNVNGKTDFEGKISFIDAVQSLYQPEDFTKELAMMCKKTISIFKEKNIDGDFCFKESDTVSSPLQLELNDAKEFEDIEGFVDHLCMMLGIWKKEIIKRWNSY